jgi:hypothetical protein
MKKIISNLLVVLLAAMLISARAETRSDAETAVPYIELTSVPKLGETKNVQGNVYLGDMDPADYVIIAIVGGSWPKPYFDSYQNKLTASGDEGYATFGFSVTTGGQDASYNTFTLYLCEAALFEGVSATSVTDSYMQYRYIVKMEIDKTVFNAQTEQPELTPAPSAESYVFQVYDDALVHYGDIAYMGSKNNGNDGSVTIDPGYGENPHSGGKCMQITYTPPSSSHWAGMMWLSGENNFPPNLPVEGVDTAKTSQLSFYARGYGSTKFFIEDETGQQVTLKVALTSDWTQYTLAIPSDWANVCVGFGFASSGASGDGTIYLDDIAFSN